MVERFTVRSTKKEELLEVTDQVQDALRRGAVDSGVCVVYTPHTTAAITINENADPDVKRDILLGLRKVFPEDPEYRHYEKNSAAHLKSSVIGCSEVVFVEKGRLLLGRWQGIYFCEFDGPRQREVLVRVFS